MFLLLLSSSAVKIRLPLAGWRDAVINVPFEAHTKRAVDSVSGVPALSALTAKRYLYFTCHISNFVAGEGFEPPTFGL